MSDPAAYLLMAVAAIVTLVSLWAIISVFRSDKSVEVKALWALVIALFPLLGVIAWVIAGPRGVGESPLSRRRG